MINQPSIVDILGCTVYVSSNQQLIQFLLFLKLIFLLKWIIRFQAHIQTVEDEMKLCMKYDHNIAGNTRVILLIADKSDIQTETHFHEHLDLLQAYFFQYNPDKVLEFKSGKWVRKISKSFNLLILK